MELILQELIKSISQFSPMVSTTFLFVLLVMSLVVTKRDILIDKISGLKHVFGITKINRLHHHSLFNVTDDVAVKIKFVKFYFDDGNVDEVKSKMFVDFMNIKIIHIKACFHQLINDAQEPMGMDAFKDLIIKAIRKTVEAYIKETRELFLSKGISLEDAEYVINLFEKWRLETIESLQDGIGRIFSSQYHHSKFEKLLCVLELVSIAVDLIPKDGIAAFEDMNGRFKNIKKY